MFYRIKNNKLSDYADYAYASDCLYTDICTMEGYNAEPEIYEVSDGQIKLIPNSNDILAQKRQIQFEKEFFRTSLGWIRRKVTMKDGTTRDFLSDLLLPVKAGMELGQIVEIITYNTPDFFKELTADYMVSLQEIKQATSEFIRECLFQTVQDFGLNSGGNNGF